MIGKIIALVGPSGVGKDFSKKAIKKQLIHFSEPTVYTTRPRRVSDGKDRKTISLRDFSEMKDQGKLIGAHQLFGKEGHWYGFSREEIDQFLEKGETVLTEIHPDNVRIFKKIYQEKLFTVALMAEQEYLEHNLRSRRSEQEEEIKRRITDSQKEVETIKELREAGLIDSFVEVGWDNRETLSEIMVERVSGEVKSLSRENKLNLS